MTGLIRSAGPVIKKLISPCADKCPEKFFLQPAGIRIASNQANESLPQA